MVREGSADAAMIVGSASIQDRVERVSAVDLSPEMFELAPGFEPWNHAFHRSPKVRKVVGGGPQKQLVRSAPAAYPHVSLWLADNQEDILLMSDQPLYIETEVRNNTLQTRIPPLEVLDPTES